MWLDVFLTPDAIHFQKKLSVLHFWRLVMYFLEAHCVTCESVVFARAHIVQICMNIFLARYESHLLSLF